jgi:hypothetical protein
MLDPVHPVADFHLVWHGQDRSLPECAWPDLHPALEPADDCSAGEQVSDIVGDI